MTTTSVPAHAGGSGVGLRRHTRSAIHPTDTARRRAPHGTCVGASIEGIDSHTTAAGVWAGTRDASHHPAAPARAASAIAPAACHARRGCAAASPREPGPASVPERSQGFFELDAHIAHVLKAALAIFFQTPAHQKSGTDGYRRRKHGVVRRRPEHAGQRLSRRSLRKRRRAGQQLVEHDTERPDI